MFNRVNPVIVQIRRELRGQFADSWIEEIVGILEYELSYQTLDELSSESLLKLRTASLQSPTLKRALDSTISQNKTPPNFQNPSPPPFPERGFPFRLPWS